MLTTCFLSQFVFYGFTNNPMTRKDKTAPKIELLSPTKHFEVMRGECININALLQDDIELDSYLLVITKGGILSNKYADTFSSFYNMDANGDVLPSVSGLKSYMLNVKIKVDETTLVGDYNLTLYLEDKAGNEKIERLFFYVARH